MKRSPLMKAMRTLGCATLLTILLLPLAAQAQTTNNAFVWLPKFVCGFELGDVRELSDPSPLNEPYEDFKPGNYATTINITNTSVENRTVYAVALVTVPVPAPAPGTPLVTTALAVPIITPQPLLPMFPPILGVGVTGTLELSCINIASAMVANGFPLNGQTIEGKVFLVTNAGDDSLDVTAVYTMESKDSFRDTELVFVGVEPPSKPGLPGMEIVEAVGQGGQGLGASIDVEHYDAVTVDLSPLGGAGIQGLLDSLEGEPPVQ